MMSYRSIKGFTLIEMIVVVAIIAILMAMIFPVFSRVKEQAVRNSCIHNMRVIAQGVMIYHQDYNAYPNMPGGVGLRGIPRGGVTGLNISAISIAESSLWCTRDTYPERLGRTDISRDQTDSTYQYGYNRFGYVTTYSGLPFPVTTVEAANYFFGDPRVVDPSFDSYDLANKDCKWNLGLIEQKNGQPFNIPRGLYQGLWNYRAPSNTIITMCLNHIEGSGYPETVPAVTVGGEALMLHPVRSNASDSGFIGRRPPATPRPAIDWRINREPFSAKADTMASFGDSLGNNAATSMPLVQVMYRKFTADTDLSSSAQSTPTGYGFYDTGVAVNPGDYVMVVANAKWAWKANDKILDPTVFTANQKYALLFNEQGKILFTADGDPVETSFGASMLFANKPHCQLIGYIGDVNAASIDTNQLKYLASRASWLIPATATPGSTIKLSLNDTTSGVGGIDYADNVGWCEAWIAVFKPRPAP